MCFCFPARSPAASCPGLAGFGTALMALGIWLYVLPPSTAVPLVLICSIVAQTSTLPSFWRSFDFSWYGRL